MIYQSSLSLKSKQLHLIVFLENAPISEKESVIKKEPICPLESNIMYNYIISTFWIFALLKNG